ncbi:MAG TPA: hypothetical protein VGM88_33610 [Kofleriaceae bacterium]|jgi:hypothetical protein
MRRAVTVTLFLLLAAWKPQHEDYPLKNLPHEPTQTIHTSFAKLGKHLRITVPAFYVHSPTSDMSDVQPIPAEACSKENHDCTFDLNAQSVFLPSIMLRVLDKLPEDGSTTGLFEMVGAWKCTKSECSYLRDQRGMHRITRAFSVGGHALMCDVYVDLPASLYDPSLTDWAKQVCNSIVLK